MAVTMKQMSVIVTALGVASFIFGIVAENKKVCFYWFLTLPSFAYRVVSFCFEMHFYLFNINFSIFLYQFEDSNAGASLFFKIVLLFSKVFSKFKNYFSILKDRKLFSVWGHSLSGWFYTMRSKLKYRERIGNFTSYKSRKCFSKATVKNNFFKIVFSKREKFNNFLRLPNPFGKFQLVCWL